MYYLLQWGWYHIRRAMPSVVCRSNWISLHQPGRAVIRCTIYRHQHHHVLSSQSETTIKTDTISINLYFMWSDMIGGYWRCSIAYFKVTKCQMFFKRSTTVETDTQIVSHIDRDTNSQRNIQTQAEYDLRRWQLKLYLPSTVSETFVQAETEHIFRDTKSRGFVGVFVSNPFKKHIRLPITQDDGVTFLSTQVIICFVNTCCIREKMQTSELAGVCVLMSF